MIGYETISTEEWRDIEGFVGVYQISNFGRLKSFKQYKCGKVMKTTNKKGGYLSVVLQAEGKTRSTRIHRLVAEALRKLCWAIRKWSRCFWGNRNMPKKYTPGLQWRKKRAWLFAQICRGLHLAL